MKVNRVIGLIILVLGILIALVPEVIFPTCEELVETASGSFMPMKCHWAGMAEIGIGGVVVWAGAILIISSKPQINIGISLMLVAVNVVGLLIPSVLIGGCMLETMDCQLKTFPALYVLNCLEIIVTLVGLWQFKKQDRIIARNNLS